MSMSAAFRSAIDSTYRVHGESATYSPRDAASSSVLVVHSVEPAASSGFDAGARQTDTVLRVRASQVAEPKRGDTVTLQDGTCHTVQDADPLSRWEWRLVVK